MDNREIVIRALSRDNPVRVPKEASFTPLVAEKLKEKIGRNDFETYFNMEMRGVGISPTKRKTDFSRYLPSNLPEGTTIDETGIAHVPGSMYHFTKMRHPLVTLTNVKELEEYPFPDETEAYRYDGLNEKVDKLHKEGYFVIGAVGHIFEAAWGMRGMEELFADFMLNHDFATYLLDKITSSREIMAEEMAKAGCDQILLGDDIAMQNKMIMSPETWKKWIKPRLAEVIAKAKAVNQKIFVYYHSDGNIRDVIPDLIEVGVNVLNPVQPECMDPSDIKKKYGNKLSFWGTIGTQTTMPFGTPEDVKKEVKKRIETVGYDGGLVLAPTHILEPDVPVDNILAFFDAVSEFGYYK